jgi:hypothetical protein
MARSATLGAQPDAAALLAQASPVGRGSIPEDWATWRRYGG